MIAVEEGEEADYCHEANVRKAMSSIHDMVKEEGDEGGFVTTTCEVALSEAEGLIKLVEEE